jgi:hypothetical protein
LRHTKFHQLARIAIFNTFSWKETLIIKSIHRTLTGLKRHNKKLIESANSLQPQLRQSVVIKKINKKKKKDINFIMEILLKKNLLQPKNLSKKVPKVQRIAQNKVLK